MTFSDLAREFHAHRTQNPNARVQLGLADGLGALPDPSLERATDHARAARRLLGAIDALPRAGLAFDEQLDLDLARLMLEAECFDASYEFNGLTTLPQQPRAGDEIGEGIFLLSVADPRPAAERLEDVTARVEQIPQYLEELLRRLKTPVARWVAMDVAKVRELPVLLASMESWANAEHWAGRERLSRANVAARVALAGYERRLAELPSRPELAVGAAIAERIVALRGIEQSLDELHSMARSFLGDTQQEIEHLRQGLVDKYGLHAATTREELHRFLNHRFRVQVPPGQLEQVLVRYRAEHERVTQFIRERELFPIPDDQALLILETPGFMRPSIPAGAMMPPAPFRGGTATSLIFLTLSEELLDEHTELSIPIMMIHEGVPGHHLQLATAAKHPSVIRRHVSANDHAEGWTTMLEDYMLDRGYVGELADEARFCAKRDLCRIGARVAIDLFFMTGERDYLDVGMGVERGHPDPFDAAAALLEAVTGFTPGRVQAELNWYSLERGYPLCYLTGNRLVARLRADLEQAQRQRHSAERLDRIFFERYLRSGNMPLSFLRRVFQHEGWIAS